MKVLKFGGTSVGSVESLANVKAIVESIGEPAIVVVSALGGITDRLIATAKEARDSSSANPNGWKKSFEGIVERHHRMIDGIVIPANRDSVRHEINTLLTELCRLYTGVAMLNDLSERVLDRIVSFGERMSTAIVGGTIEGIRRVYSPDFIRTSRHHGRNRLDNEATSHLIDEHIAGADQSGSLILTAGFISADADGDITNLGRGGSDYTAAILAAHFNADILEIWTDVDGFLTADPRKIKSASVISQMSFVEAMELCNFGAKVVYPPTIYPVFHKNIPIYIKNTFNPTAPGTRISDSRLSTNTSVAPVTGISSLPGCSLVTLRFSEQLKASALSARAFNALTRKGIDVFLSSNRTSGQEVHFVVRDSDSYATMDELEIEFASELSSGSISLAQPRSGLATVAAVGETLSQAADWKQHLSDAVESRGHEVLARSEGKSGSSIALVVEGEAERSALEAMHQLVFSEPDNI